MWPLAARLPNPPPLLVGRDGDVERLVEALGHGRLAVVYGPGGVGATALVLHAVHRVLGREVARCGYLELGDEDPAAAVIRHLAPGTPHGPAGSAGLAHDERALQLAEHHDLWVVLDGATDAHWRLATLASRYARTSRWVVISTKLPRDVILEYAQPIARLPDTALEALANRWHPALDPDERAFAVTASRGSPRRLRRMLADRMQSKPYMFAAGDDDLVGERVLGFCSATEYAMPIAMIIELTEATMLQLEDLDDRGLVKLHGSVVTLGDVRNIRELDPARARVLAERLASETDLLAVAEAIRLALVARDPGLALTMLDRDGSRLVASGFASRLARTLSASRDPALARWRLRAAVEIGDGAVLPELVADSLRTKNPGDRLLWAEAQMRTNNIEAALAIAATIDDPAARLLLARGYGTRGEIETARAELAAIKQWPDVPELVAVRALALEARLEALAGAAGPARAAAEELHARVGELSDVTRCEVLQSIASTHHDLGDLDTTERTLDELELAMHGAELERFIGRRALLVRAAAWIDRGRLADAELTLSELEHAASFATLHQPFIALLHAQLAIARGDTEAAHHALALVREVEVGTGYLGAWAAALGAQLALLAPASALTRLPPAGNGLWPTVARLHHARVALREGRELGDLTLDLELAAAGVFEASFAAQALGWERALLAGDAVRAHELALVAATRCAEAGFGVAEAIAVSAALDAAMIARVPPGYLVDRLRTLGDRLGSRRFCDDAELASVLLGDRAPEKLERFAATTGPASRRARHALGQARAADPIDRAVCEALGVRPATIVLGATADVPGWGVDRTRRRAWLPDGTVRELGDKPQLWKLLETLVGSPHLATKEVLVESAWGTPYHPLRHDKLLHNAIHKLRKLLDGAGRIETTSEGYKLGDSEPLRVVD